MLPRNSIKKAVLIVFLLGIGLALNVPSYAYLVMPSSYSFSREPNAGWINGGSYTYDDSSYTKLTDGIRGQDNWTEDYQDWVGWWGISYQGNADQDGRISKGDYANNPVTITFSFQQSFELSSINLWTNQDAIHSFNVVYPGEISIKRNGTELVSLTSSFLKGRSGTDNGYNNGRLHEISFDLGSLDIQSNDEISITLSNWNIFSQLQESGNDWEYADILWNNDSNSAHNGMFWLFLSEVEFESPNPVSTTVPIPGSLLLLGSGVVFLVGLTRRKAKN